MIFNSFEIELILKKYESDFSKFLTYWKIYETYHDYLMYENAGEISQQVDNYFLALTNETNVVTALRNLVALGEGQVEKMSVDDLIAEAITLKDKILQVDERVRHDGHSNKKNEGIPILSRLNKIMRLLRRKDIASVKDIRIIQRYDLHIVFSFLSDINRLKAKVRHT